MKPKCWLFHYVLWQFTYQSWTVAFWTLPLHSGYSAYFPMFVIWLLAQVFLKICIVFSCWHQPRLRHWYEQSSAICGSSEWFDLLIFHDFAGVIFDLFFLGRAKPLPRSHPIILNLQMMLIKLNIKEMHFKNVNHLAHALYKKILNTFTVERLCITSSCLLLFVISRPTVSGLILNNLIKLTSCMYFSIFGVKATGYSVW